MLRELGVPGFSLKFDVREESGYDVTVTDDIVINEMFLENVYDIHDGDFETCDVFVDLGANIGAASILAYTKGARRILAYEPEKNNIIQLNKNINLNLLKSYINSIKKAVSNKAGKVTIFDGQGASFIDKAKGVRSDLIGAIPEEREEVEAISLNKALAPVEEVAVLKIDVEGSEYLIIEGATEETLKKCRRIVMEYHRTDDETFGLMVAKLSLYFNLRIFGNYTDNGGQIDARRY